MIPEAVILDTETTGTVDPEVIEAAWRYVDIYGQGVGSSFSQRFKPSKPISLGALATHHIMDEDLVDCSPTGSFALLAGVEYLIGHNVDFDWRAIGSPPLKRIDTCALSRVVWPDADSHSLGALMYLVDRQGARQRLAGAHSAIVDVDNCRLLLEKIIVALVVVTFEDLWLASEAARVPTVMPFGKHLGMPIREVPRDYKQWLLRQPDVDPYLERALRAWNGDGARAGAR
jgi:exodeoxyribonuclease X